MMLMFFLYVIHNIIIVDDKFTVDVFFRSRNGRFIASGGEDATLRVWTMNSEREQVSHYATLFCTAGILSMDWVHSSEQVLLFG